MIGRTGDVDAYKFSIGSTHTLRIRAWPTTSANLNIRGTLKTSAGTVKVTAAPTTGLGVDFTVTLGAGVYVFYLSGAGEGTATDSGYSSYASLGYYGTQLDWA